ncbi:beta-1,4 N-acetylgalactosaminyltransferase 2-like isoform X1 [Cheilinus undulatus]|uniref:beta-1,4 N-acetylgalactosaminyltransferase 2-like isoform X1 n=1 Tax=Cheilinus undulatus TaxID=241271 RepID=UPI001BD2A9ED|nr:beta-1,4 N-acetylgalactosaminyltransferase 2-like isoform X1 [Cheilinus undulatus]
MTFNLDHLKGGLFAVILLVLFYLVIFYNRSSIMAEDFIQLYQTPRVSPSRSAAATSSPCTCFERSTIFKDRFPEKEYAELASRRAKEIQSYKARTTSVLSELLLAAPNTPLQYPIQGFNARPLTPTLIPGLRLFPEQRKSYRVTLQASRGVLTTETPPADVDVLGDSQDVLIIESRNLHSLNYVLTKVSYQSTIYHIHTGDLVTLSYEHHKVVFPVTIKLPKVPVMFDMGKDINSQVTIVTKTFIRYYNLRMLIKSIREFYPNITIIIADDSFEPQRVTEDNILQYIMPPGQGWFAGRNLAISQVMTKYFLWVDDDYEFTEKTTIEKMVEVMEANPELDVLGGSVKGNRFFFSVIYEEGNEIEGGCLYRKSGGRFQHLPGFPGCYLVSGVVNFFMARTDSLQKTGFDPRLRRVAHSEYFIDGAGSLMVASCGDVIVGHQTNKSKEDAARYARYRNPGRDDWMFKDRLLFFKNNLKCMRWG